MKAEELRIGNKVYRVFDSISDPNDTEVVSLGSINSITNTFVCKDDCIGSLDELQHIPLTEEILLKCGFVKCKMSNVFYLGDFEILLPTYFKYKDAHLIKIKYLHQLQNLYFALTGKELKIEM